MLQKLTRSKTESSAELRPAETLADSALPASPVETSASPGIEVNAPSANGVHPTLSLHIDCVPVCDRRVMLSEDST